MRLPGSSIWDTKTQIDHDRPWVRAGFPYNSAQCVGINQWEIPLWSVHWWNRHIADISALIYNMLWIYCLSCVSRPAHDISLEEFDDEDLSEITDDCGIGLNYDSDPYEKVRLLCSYVVSLIDIWPFRVHSCALCLEYVNMQTHSVNSCVKAHHICVKWTAVHEKQCKSFNCLQM